MKKTFFTFFSKKDSQKKICLLAEFLQDISLLIAHCKRNKTIQPILELPQSLRVEIKDTAFLLSEEWSELFLTLIAQKQIDDVLALEDILQESAHRSVVEALKNLLNLSLQQWQESNLRLYKIRRIYYQLSTYFNENDAMMSYDIPLYHPSLHLLWIHSLEDIS